MDAWDFFFNTGFVGIANKLYYDKKLAEKQAKMNRLTETEMEEFCQKTANKYGVKRGIDLLQLQQAIVDKSYYDDELLMTNEEAVPVLEQELQELIRRREEMFDRAKKIPMEAIFSQDRLSIRAGRNIENWSRGGWNERLKKAEKYLEGKGIDIPTEQYIPRIFNWARNLVTEVEKDLAILRKGLYGEEYVNEHLKVYEGKYKVLKNIVLDSKDSMGNTSEVDAYIITDKGLVVTEIKNFGNENQRLHISSDGRWTIEDRYNGNVLNVIEKSPVEQNTRHCLAVERFLKEHFGEDCNIPIIPVIFIGNNKVDIRNESRSRVIRVSEFYTMMQDINGVSISKEMQNEIEKLLKSKDVGVQKFTVKSRRKKMGCLEELERYFTAYINYNAEVAVEYEATVKRNTVFTVSKKALLLLIIPALLLFLSPVKLPWKIFFSVCYVMSMFNLPIAILIGVIGALFGEVILKGIAVIVVLGFLCGGFGCKDVIIDQFGNIWDRR